MYCLDTGQTEAIRIEGMTVHDAKIIGPALCAIRKNDHGNGELHIPLLHGVLKRVQAIFDIYSDDKK